MAVAPLRVGVALGAYSSQLAKMDGIVEKADHDPEEDEEQESSSDEDAADAGDGDAFLSCNSGDEGYIDSDESDGEDK